MTGFKLRKWYLDVVDPAGRSVILYWSALKWGPLNVRWHAATLHEPGALPRHVSSLAAAPEPVVHGGEITWRAEAIGCEAVARPTMPAVAAVLLAGRGPSPDARVTWICEAPAARTLVRLAGEATVEGTGYAEQLELRLPPWRLPIDQLRWGRWMSDQGDRSVVWIDWQGAEAQTRVYADALPAGEPVVGDDEIEADGQRLRFADRRVLHERTLGDLLGPVAVLLAGMPRRWLALEDRKWLSRGVLTGPAGTQDQGWAIHERIVFP